MFENLDLLTDRFELAEMGLTAEEVDGYVSFFFKHFFRDLPPNKYRTRHQRSTDEQHWDVS